MSAVAHKPLVYIISAPSGSGKSTLVNELLKSVRNLDFSISYTPRPPRGSEVDGKQYYFDSRSEFEKMILDDELLEHAEVFGNYYGTERRVLCEAELRIVARADCCRLANVRERLKRILDSFKPPGDSGTG